MTSDATRAAQLPRVSPVVRRVLWADAGVELVAAIALAGLAWPIHAWLNVSEGVTLAAAGIFVVAAIALAAAAVSRRTSPAFVRMLAWANIAGGVAAWLVLLLGWGHFATEGRWVMGAAADSFILLGVLELVALRRMTRD